MKAELIGGPLDGTVFNAPDGSNEIYFPRMGTEPFEAFHVTDETALNPPRDTIYVYQRISRSSVMHTEGFALYAYKQREER